MAGNTIYFVASALGLAALILASHQLFLVLKWMGIAYLLWLGLQMLNTKTSNSAPEDGPTLPVGKVFGGGVVLQLANPKNLIFFMAILPLFIDSSGNIALQVLILGLTSQTLEIIALLIYGSLASKARGWYRLSSTAVWVDRLAGSVLIAIGASLAFMRRVTP